MPYSRRNGVAIHYEVAGEGPPMVFIHANPFDSTMWMYQVAHLSTWFRTICVDLRSYGRSDKVTEPFTLADMCNDVWGVCQDEGAENAILVGLSVGSKMVPMLADQHPGRFPALILAGGTCSPQLPPHFDRQIKGYSEQGVEAFHRGHLTGLFSPEFARSPLGQHIIETYVERDSTLSGLAIAQGFRALGEVDMLPRLPSLTMPALVINGEFDSALPRGKIAAERFGNGAHVTLPGSGHACCLEDPAQFNAAMIAFLSQHGLMPSLTPVSHR